MLARFPLASYASVVVVLSGPVISSISDVPA